MLILGLNGYRADETEDNSHTLRGHDSAAVLVRDGAILSAFEEERLSRVKHCNFFPARAIRRCLEAHQLRLADVDWIALNMEEATCRQEANWRYLDDATCESRDARRFYGAQFERQFGIDVAHKLRFCNHHLAHAWSAYGPSGHADSLVVVFDGEGDWKSGGVFSGEGGHLSELRSYRVNQSLGHFYTSIIRLLGYNEFDEYKAMGLAPYGDPAVYGELFRGLYALLPQGDYELATGNERFRLLEKARLIDGARRKGQPFTQMHMDVAAALQASLETIVQHVLRHYRQATGHRKLCLAGGVAHNCSVNGKVLGWGLFEQVFVQPAAHDAGGALGAALHALHEEGARRPARLHHLALGSDLGTPRDVERSLQAWGDLVSIRTSADIARDAAAMIAEGEVIGWVQGRAEFGPRALGHRSILADPRPASNQQRINGMVKKREAYRPFAPSVQQERLHDYFDVPAAAADLSFMTYVLQVKKPMRGTLGAVTHVDGTARVQTVSREHDPLYWRLIESFGQHTGVHVLLNTSFNNHAEPIVDSVHDAVTCFLTTGLDALVVGDCIVLKKDLAGSSAPHEHLVPGLPPSRTLVQAQQLAGPGTTETVHRIGGTMNRFFARRSIDIPVEAWRVLQQADGRRPLGALLDGLGVSADDRRAVVDTLLHLWSERFITLLPSTTA